MDLEKSLRNQSLLVLELWTTIASSCSFRRKNNKITECHIGHTLSFESHRVLVSGYINHICCMLLHLCNLFGSLSEGGRASTGLNRTRPTVAELRDESAHLHMSNTLSYKRIQTLNGTTHCGSAMLWHAILFCQLWMMHNSCQILNDLQDVASPMLQKKRHCLHNTCRQLKPQKRPPQKLAAKRSWVAAIGVLHALQRASSWCLDHSGSAKLAGLNAYNL